MARKTARANRIAAIIGRAQEERDQARAAEAESRDKANPSTASTNDYFAACRPHDREGSTS